MNKILLLLAFLFTPGAGKLNDLTYFFIAVDDLKPLY